MLLAKMIDHVFAPRSRSIDASKQQRNDDQQNTSAQSERPHQNARVASNTNRQNTQPRRESSVDSVSEMKRTTMKFWSVLQDQESTMSLDKSEEAQNVPNNVIAAEDKNQETRENFDTSQNQQEHAVDADDKRFIKVKPPTVDARRDTMLVIGIRWIPP